MNLRGAPSRRRDYGASPSPSSTEVERRLKADRGTAMAMATERKFSRFATSDRSLQTREIPEGGICLSAFVDVNETSRDQIARYHEDILAHVGRWGLARG